MRRGFLILSLMVTSQLACAGTSADYGLDLQVINGGGLAGASKDYTASFSFNQGGYGSSSGYGQWGGFAGQIGPFLVITPPDSLLADGGPKGFVTQTDLGGTLTQTYEGRLDTSYGPSSYAPSLPGFYRVQVEVANSALKITLDQDFIIHGVAARGDAMAKPADNAPMVISVSDLLANDVALAFGGASSPSLAIVSVAAGPGSAAYLGTGANAAWILFVPSSASSESFTYRVTDGTNVALGTVTVSQLNSAPAFSLRLIFLGEVTFNGQRTTAAFDFLGIPGQNYQIEYSTDLANWFSAGTVPTGTTGSFTLNLSRLGDHAEAWRSRMYFRARR